MLRRFWKIFNGQTAAQPGSILLYVIVFGTLAFSLVVIAISGYAISEHQAARYRVGQEQAFQIAEAGINYYRWHLAHNPTDYTDGTSTPGPYVHTYYNKDGVAIGQFSLTITPPATGSTVVTIQSTGSITSEPNASRIIRVRLGFPSVANYAFLTNSDVWIGNNEIINGRFHANGGIRFDGTGNAPITSAMATYTCQAVHGCNNLTKPGIWGQGGPTSFWSYPVPAWDFSAVTAKLEQMKTLTQADGIFLPSSGQQGWHLQFNADGTVSIAKVLSTVAYKAGDTNSNKYFWSSIDIRTLGPATIYPMPTSSYIYVDDQVWVDGTVNGRVTVGTSPGNSIMVDNNLVYTAKDGSDVLGLIADQNILIPHDVPDTMEIDAALLAQNGAAKRYYYPGDLKDSLTIYGSVITNGLWTWSWVSQGGAIVSGFKNTDSIYDTNLTYNPPGGFPVGSTYNIISWEEVK